MEIKDTEEVMQALNSLIIDDRAYIVDMLCEMRGSVSQFAKSEECFYYNLGLEHASKMILSLNKARTAEE
jgi:hypothetical protein